ncbi:MAG: hypothetical protein KAT88_12645, partial [Spirochaetes bacterium]|nr:hypothetical protein [Spirochaetota bacterium]
MKLEKSEVDVFFSPIARPDPNYVYKGGCEGGGLILFSNFSLLNHNVPIPDYNFPVLYDMF